MGRKSTTVITVLVAVLLTSIGIFLLNGIKQPELPIEHMPDEVNINVSDPEVHLDNRLIIKAIGVDMKIGNESSYLDFGGWVQRSFQEIPQVIAVHRFGWYTLTPDQKQKQTLFNADRLKKEDAVEITWNNQLHKFKVVHISTSTNNPSIKNGQVLLYTCKTWDSNERIFILLEQEDKFSL